MTAPVGRFAPSPTGPLHMGSLVAALGSWLFARSEGGRWLVRMEDLDTPRVVPGAAREILGTLERYGLEWDGEVVFQSERIPAYDDALAGLRSAGAAYDCSCSRAEAARAASAPAPGDESEGPVYPGTCRAGIAGRRPRAVRLLVPDVQIAFRDRVFGEVVEAVARKTGDFVLKRADGPYAYQLAVVVDDAFLGVTSVVRGADLLSSTPRQIVLQRLLGLPEPSYAHLPLVVGPDGRKIGKRDGALPLESLDEGRIRRSLRSALRILGQAAADGSPAEIVRAAAESFDPARIPRGPVALEAEPSAPTG